MEQINNLFNLFHKELKSDQKTVTKTETNNMLQDKTGLYGNIYSEVL